MVTIIFLFIIISILCSIVVVAACVKSSQVTKWENLPEDYEETTEVEPAPTLASRSLSQAA